MRTAAIGTYWKENSKRREGPSIARPRPTRYLFAASEWWTEMNSDRTTTRRRAIRATGLLLTAGLAGCGAPGGESEDEGGEGGEGGEGEQGEGGGENEGGGDGGGGEEGGGY
jgi:hypothetical protein